MTNLMLLVAKPHGVVAAIRKTSSKRKAVYDTISSTRDSAVHVELFPNLELNLPSPIFELLLSTALPTTLPYVQPDP